MRKAMVAGAALAGGLLVSTLIGSSAQAASALNLKSALGNTSTVTLVGRGGGGGHMGGMGSGGAGGMGGGRVGGMDGGRVGGVGHISGGGEGRSFSSRSLSGGSGHIKSMSGGTSHFKTGRIAGGDVTGPRNFSKRNLNNGPSVKARDRFAESNWKGGKNWRDHDKHVAMRDHDHDKFNHFNRHRVFRNGVWFWAYGPDYYAGDDCLWLVRRAQTTGSNYWWSRYNACVAYY